MKCDDDIRVNFYADVVLSSSTTMFQEIGECMTKATGGVGSIINVLSRASSVSVFCFFSGLLRSRCIFVIFSLVTVCLVAVRHLVNTAPCSHVSCPTKMNTYEVVERKGSLKIPVLVGAVALSRRPSHPGAGT